GTPIDETSGKIRFSKQNCPYCDGSGCSACGGGIDQAKFEAMAATRDIPPEIAAQGREAVDAYKNGETVVPAAPTAAKTSTGETAEDSGAQATEAAGNTAPAAPATPAAQAAPEAPATQAPAQALPTGVNITAPQQ